MYIWRVKLNIENANFICRKTKKNKKELDAIKWRKNLAHLQNFPRFVSNNKNNNNN
jgi:hypothetical protein